MLSMPPLPRRRLGTTKAALRVYDPYFCEGRMVQHMAQLGYESVYNRWVLESVYSSWGWNRSTTGGHCIDLLQLSFERVYSRGCINRYILGSVCYT